MKFPFLYFSRTGGVLVEFPCTGICVETACAKGQVVQTQPGPKNALEQFIDPCLAQKIRAQGPGGMTNSDTQFPRDRCNKFIAEEHVHWGLCRKPTCAIIELPGNMFFCFCFTEEAQYMGQHSGKRI